MEDKEDKETRRHGDEMLTRPGNDEARCRGGDRTRHQATRQREARKLRPLILMVRRK